LTGRSTSVPAWIEDYALIGDTQTAGLVARDGSLDWLCLPRFDSAACFAALLGGPEHGRWLITPSPPAHRCERRYRPDTLVLETDFHTECGVVRVVDCMPIAPKGGLEHHDVVRLVEGIEGAVPMRMELVVRFDYGSSVPWVRRRDDLLWAVAGPDALALTTPVTVRGHGLSHVAEFEVSAGETAGFVLAWHHSHEPVPEPVAARDAIDATERWWRAWSAGTRYDGDWQQPVRRSLVVLKALTYAPTGGVVAAATTSLPEQLGGERNWDYRYCWLRDATLTLDSLLGAGHTAEAAAWRDWLLRAVAGRPEEMQIMYGPAGERRLPELELPWLPGYEGSRPVRTGNAAADQFQLDVYGEVMAALYDARRGGIEPDPFAWRLQLKLLEQLESCWREPDEGIWEVRSERRHFTHSKVMAWTAFDRAVRTVEEMGLDGPVDRWRHVREEIRQEVLARGYDSDREAFVQSYGSRALDASLLMLPLVGFLPASDPRMASTVAAIQEELCEDGLVRRYLTPHEDVDGLPPGEGAFLPCSFWLVDNLALLGRHDEARGLFERLLELRNDVGLFAEEYDPRSRRMLGNFPQAFTHTSMVRSAAVLSQPARRHRDDTPGWPLGGAAIGQS
jgi:GH15 family glucan-1,4-alpha-glucosidase